MVAPRHSRALEQALRKLADMRPSDKGEILALLDPLSRVRVEKMLASENGDSPPGGDRTWQNYGFSENMRARLATGSGLRPDAHALLRQCADGMTPPSADSPSLFDRLTAHFVRRSSSR